MIIKEVNDKDGTRCTTSNTTVHTFFNFHQTLHSQEDVHPTVVERFLCHLPKVEVEDAELLREKVSQEKIESSIEQMENNNSLRPDSLSKEFYACFLPRLSPILLRVCGAMYELRTLSDSQKMSIKFYCVKTKNNPGLP